MSIKRNQLRANIIGVLDHADRFFRHLRLIGQIRQEREQLCQLDQRQLLDIGIDKFEASQEGDRELLDIPANRLPLSILPESNPPVGLAQGLGHATERALLKT